MSINKEMNILIVGNGFDLAHYLPTKYDHFMGVMQSVEAWDISKDDMKFDDLFGSFYEREGWFFGYTKAMYKTEEVKLTVSQIETLQKQLKENVWYQYFSDHVKELKTWIDFETKIEEALTVCCDFFQKYKSVKLDKGVVSNEIAELGGNSAGDIVLLKKYINILVLLTVIKRIKANEKYQQFGFSDSHLMEEISPDFNLKIAGDIDFSYSKCLDFLHSQLENFIQLFNNYLVDCIQALSVRTTLKVPEQISEVHQIFSFNYTDTFNRFYPHKAKIDYLHGRTGSEQSIVLGISKLPHKILKKHKAYGFIKYHQKLMKGTDYLFLNKTYSDQKTNLLLLDEAKALYRASMVDPGLRGHYSKRVNDLDVKLRLNLNFAIWGHSLDISDKDYIKELFSLQDDQDFNVRVVVFFYDANAKFSMLSNLIHILGNHKVETWMKKGWLKFEPVPNIAEVNGIKASI